MKKEISTKDGRHYVQLSAVLSMIVFVIVDKSPANGTYLLEMAGVMGLTAVTTAILLALVS